MLRKLIASLVTVYAIAFAFGALTAVRWPSMMMVVGWMMQDDVAGGLDTVDWRALGIAYGAPYLLAALCFYCSAAMISGRRPGAVLWYVLGLCAGFPTIYLVSFEEGWWQDPSAAEGAVAGAAMGGLLLLSAVCELRRRAPVRVAARVDTAQPEPIADTPSFPSSPTPEVAIIRPRPVTPRPAFVPAAIARQRASFAAHGRRVNARRNEVRNIRLF